MDQKQSNTKTTSQSLPPRISIFDKKAQNKFNLQNVNKITDNRDKTPVNAPQFRINQHKGA